MFLITVLIFVAMVALASAAGMKMYVRPKEAMERVVGIMGPAETQVEHPSLAFHEIIKRLGNFVPQSPKDVTVMQRRLIRAGIRKEGALKVCMAPRSPRASSSLLRGVHAGMATDSGNKVAPYWRAARLLRSNEYVRRLAAKRQHQLAGDYRALTGWSAESGLVGIRPSSGFPRSWSLHIEISEEFGFVNLELKAGGAALRPCETGERTGWKISSWWPS
jgi:hypothetical protein